MLCSGLYGNVVRLWVLWSFCCEFLHLQIHISVLSELTITLTRSLPWFILCVRRYLVRCFPYTYVFSCLVCLHSASRNHPAILLQKAGQKVQVHRIEEVQNIGTGTKTINANDLHTFACVVNANIPFSF